MTERENRLVEKVETYFRKHAGDGSTLSIKAFSEEEAKEAVDILEGRQMGSFKYCPSIKGKYIDNKDLGYELNVAVDHL